MLFRKVLSILSQPGAALLASALLAVSPGIRAEQPTLLSLLMMPSLADPVYSASRSDDLTVHEIPPLPQVHGGIDLTTPSENLWDRIRNGFAMTNLNDDLVLHYQQWYQNRPDALRRMVERSRPYMHHIVEELEARGMPTELALLPMVESSFNPNAYSRAHASGLWQFIPATGKRFNLEQNWWRDERRDIVASTGAALDYLQTIYDMHGDWHLALASYNWGEGAVKRAIVKNESRGLPTDYPSLNMPNETRHYVPKLQALKNIFGNPLMVSRLGIPAIPNEPYFATLEPKRPIDIKVAARLADMSLDEFQRLNPSHNRPIIAPDTPVVLPADKVETFRSNLINAETPLTHWQAYTVPAPERLDTIAARHNTTVAELARVNGLSEKVRLGAGSTLLVPGSGIGLHNLLNGAGPQIVVAPEPMRCSKAGKGKNAKTVCSRQEVAGRDNRGSGNETAAKAAVAKSGKSDARQIKAHDRNASQAKIGSSGKPRVATSKSEKLAPAKVAKTANGRRS